MKDEQPPIRELFPKKNLGEKIDTIRLNYYTEKQKEKDEEKPE